MPSDIQVVRVWWCPRCDQPFRRSYLAQQCCPPEPDPGIVYTHDDCPERIDAHATREEAEKCAAKQEVKP